MNTEWVMLIAMVLLFGAMVAGAWFGRHQLLEHPIRAFALLLICVITGFSMWMSYRTNVTLSGPGWCVTALGADKADVDSKLDVAAACVGLLTIQLKSLATSSHIHDGVQALSLLVLVLIVLAGGRLSFTASKTGVGANISSATDVAAAADKVATAAVVEAAHVKETVPPAPPASPELRGPAMPEPPPRP